MILLAAVSAGLAAVLALPPRRRISAAGAGWNSRTWLLMALAAAALGVRFGHGNALVLVVIGLGVAAAVRQLLLRHRAGVRLEAAAGRVQEFCEAIAAELTAGRPPHQVLVGSVEEFPEFSAVATAARLGSDVPATLRRLAQAPGCEELRLVAATWQVAQRSGAGLASALDRVAGTIREGRRTSRLVAAELAAAHATARMMAALPVVFLLAGSGLGGDPVGFLTDNPAGLACLASGLLLSYAGLTWLQRIAAGVLTR